MPFEPAPFSEPNSNDGAPSSKCRGLNSDVGALGSERPVLNSEDGALGLERRDLNSEGGALGSERRVLNSNDEALSSERRDLNSDDEALGSEHRDLNSGDGALGSERVHQPRSVGTPNTCTVLKRHHTQSDPSAFSPHASAGERGRRPDEGPLSLQAQSPSTKPRVSVARVSPSARPGSRASRCIAAIQPDHISQDRRAHTRVE